MSRSVRSAWPLATAFPLTLLGGVVLVLAFDAIGALICANNPRLAYRNLWPLQFALYIIIGFVAGVSVLDPRYVGAIGALTGLVEATLGWAITWRIGPGRIEGATTSGIVVAALSMVAWGFGLSLIGYVIFTQVAGLLARR
ncbi:MAG: hypothetical protein JWO85_3387 [Candidatus Eremiobacteraeota bacterium]|nr:hypothetical protein [Candidatus Eremiobacteraeota bacterium]